MIDEVPTLRPKVISVVGRIISNRGTYKKRLHNLAADMIEQRLKMEDRYGKDYPGKPVLMMSIIVSCSHADW